MRSNVLMTCEQATRKTETSKLTIAVTTTKRNMLTTISSNSRYCSAAFLLVVAPVVAGATQAAKDLRPPSGRQRVATAV